MMVAASKKKLTKREQARQNARLGINTGGYGGGGGGRRDYVGNADGEFEVPGTGPGESSSSTSNGVSTTIVNNYSTPQNDSGADVAAMYQNWADAQDAANKAAETARLQNIQNQSETMKAILGSYGLMSLYDTVLGYIQNGYDAGAIQTLIRTTPEYKRRFPAMEALNAKGRSISEAEYISYEQAASGLERRYGLPEGMLMGNVQTMLENEVSATELNDRVMLASAAAIEAPQDVKDAFQNYYGIGSGGMTAYFLDADIATPLLEKQYAAAQIGAEAARQGIGLDVYGAQNLQGLGITTAQARQGFGEVAASQSLSEGRGDVVTQQEMVAAKLGGDTKAQEKVSRATMGKLSAFQGGGEALQTQKGAVGLGSAATR